MSLNAVYRQHNYMGEHSADSSTNTFIQTCRFDSTNNGAGTARNGMWYYNTTSHIFRGFINGVWTNISTGVGVTVNPPSSTDPGGTPANGDLYYNTTLNMYLTYDTSRGKWLSIETISIIFGKNANTAAGVYFTSIDGIILSATEGYRALNNGTIVSFSYTRTDTDAATFQMTANGTTIASLASSAVSGQSTSLNADFTAGQILGARNAAGGNTVTTVTGIFLFKWRA